MTVYAKAYVPSELSRGVRVGSVVSCLIVAMKTLGVVFGGWGWGCGLSGLGLWGVGSGA